MEVFEGNLKFYHTLTCLTGLWPYDKSILTNIQRFVVVVMTFTCIMTQMKFVYESMEKDYAAVKNNPVEMEMLMEDSILAKRIVQAYFSMVCTGGLCLVATLGVSTLVDSDIQLHFLNLLGFFYTERNLQSAIACWHIILTTSYGLLTLTVTEGGITVFATYISGLLKIASYRLKNAINTAACSDTIKEIDIRSAMDMHRRAILYTKRYLADLTVFALFLTILVIVAFGVNIYRFFISITEFSDRDAVLLSVHFVVAYTTFICGNNYTGQILMDTSAELYNDTYNSLWYRIPPKMQKMVLFTMMKTQAAIEFNLAGLFTPCYEGLTMMMSSSFSYFTLLCSV
ncbi:uncharacterized protein LOC143358222 isoform X2 [Halictus rubicundus]|uniref:uncharacterized protein LOC143358222 isoform X2 n=1 Tax=Halictus rubicundus TaxID=77578 RepID=UPI00403691DD